MSLATLKRHPISNVSPVLIEINIESDGGEEDPLGPKR